MKIRVVQHGLNKIKKTILNPNPTSPVYFRWLSNIVFTLKHSFTRSRKLKGYDNPVAIYDLRNNPLSFDFAFFLYDAECYFREKGAGFFDVYIMNEVQEGQNRGGFDNDEFVVNVLIPLASSYSFCRRVYLTWDIEDLMQVCKSTASVFPKYYDGVFSRCYSYQSVFESARRNLNFTGIPARDFRKKLLFDWLQKSNVKEKFISITVRNRLNHDLMRNTDLEVFYKFAKELTALGYGIVIVPDTENPAIGDLEEFPSYHAASVNIFDRIALYDQAYLNLASNFGPCACMMLNPRSFFIISGFFKEGSLYASSEHHSILGLRFGEQPFCEGRGVIIWEDDSVRALMEAFFLIRSLRTIA